MTQHKDIFDGVAFIGTPVSREEYAKHYDEYLKRCSGGKKEKPLRQVLVDYVDELVQSNDKSPEMVVAIAGLYQALMEL